MSSRVFLLLEVISDKIQHYTKLCFRINYLMTVYILLFMDIFKEHKIQTAAEFIELGFTAFSALLLKSCFSQRYGFWLYWKTFFWVLKRSRSKFFSFLKQTSTNNDFFCFKSQVSILLVPSLTKVTGLQEIVHSKAAGLEAHRSNFHYSKTIFCSLIYNGGLNMFST